MSDELKTNNPELEALFERYRRAPGSHVFAPLADACRKAGLFEEAIEICEKGVSTHPRYASGFVVRGKCYYDIGNADQAEASFEKVLEFDADNLVALKYMGLILAERGEARAARERFERILALDPDDREIAEKLSTLADNEPDPDASMKGIADELDAEARSRGDDASEDADDEFEGDPITLGGDNETTDVLATMTLAEIYASQGYRSKAVKIFRELLDAQPDNENVRERLRELGESRAGDVADAPAHEEDSFDDVAAPADAKAAETEAPVVSAEAAATPETPQALAETPATTRSPEPGAKSRRRSSGKPAKPSKSASDGRPVRDQASMSQFQRWLDTMNRQS